MAVTDSATLGLRGRCSPHSGHPVAIDLDFFVSQGSLTDLTPDPERDKFGVSDLSRMWQSALPEKGDQDLPDQKRLPSPETALPEMQDAFPNRRDSKNFYSGPGAARLQF